MVESSPAIVMRVRDALSETNIAVDAAPDLAEALALQQSAEPCDCILLAIDLPNRSGLELLPAMLEHTKAPVVTLGEKSCDDLICLDVVAAGAQDCLSIDRLSAPTLEHVIRSAVHRHAALTAGRREQHSAEALLAAIVRASTDPIWSVRIGGEVSSWNSGAEALLGYSAEEIVGRNVRVLAPPERVAEIDAAAATLLRGEVVGPLATERIAKDGSVRLLSITVSPIFGEDDAPVGGCVIARDLRPQKAIEDALVASEARYRGIVESAREGIAILDEDFVITFATERLACMFQRSREQLVGLSSFDLVHPEDVPAAHEQAVRTEPSAPIEVRYRLPDGSVLWGAITRTRQTDSSQPGSWLVMVTDITARKLAEQDLAEREQRFRAVFDSAYDAILIADDDRRFVDVNPAACRIYGRTREQMLELGIDDVADPDASLRPANSWDTFREGEVRTGVTSIVRPDGEVREIEFSSTPNISPSRHLSIVRDVTERNANAAEGLDMEHRLNQAERLETVGQLAGGVAHDFNNILSIIVNYAELARTADDRQSVEEDLAEITAAAARGRALTRQLLIVSRRDVARPEAFDLVALVRSIHSLLDRVIGDRIRIAVRLPDEPMIVSADRGRIDQLVMNLALNARDAMPAGGRITIAVTRRPAGPGAIGDVELVVSDNGVGMLDAVAARAFEPFYTTKGTGDGVGLGLAAAHGIVADAGGQITLTSKLGEGTAVTVVLPGTAEAPGDPGAQLGQHPLDGGRRRILIVDDDAKLLDATRRMLDRHGYATSTASCAEAALTSVSRSPVDIVLTDLVMPGMSGVGLAQDLRVRHPEIDVICMSGYSSRRGMLPDDVLLLEKPFTPEELLVAISRVGSAG